MRFRLIFSIVGFMGILSGMVMTIPAVADIFYGHFDSAKRFAVSAALCVAIGLLMRLICGVREEPLRVKEMFLTTTLVWLFCTVFSAKKFQYFLMRFSINFEVLYH